MPNCKSYSAIRVSLLLTSILILSLSISIIVANTYEQDVDTRRTLGDQANSFGRTDTRELRANEALDSIRNWALRIGRDIFYGTQEASCFRVLYDQFDPAKSDPSRRGPYKASIISNDWTSMHSDIVKTISNTMSWHKSAVESIARASESLAKNHTPDENLRFDYVDVHRLFDINDPLNGLYDQDGNLVEPPLSPTADDQTTTSQHSSTQIPEVAHTETAQLDANGQLMVTETPTTASGFEQLGSPSALVLQADRNYSSISGSMEDVEWQTPIRYMKLERHRNFGEVPISIEESAVHVPVHIFPGDPPVMNGIAWSDSLTKVFRDNFIRNPKLTNQYFASQTGFMRLFPAQRWQIPRNDPDLYDARMRPWYSAGASSRKEVVILVDASGSMTGSRRDIAKGVVFEILDTLTENDNFLILKFSDSVQQVGVPICEKMRLKRRRGANIPMKNQLYHPDDLGLAELQLAASDTQRGRSSGESGESELRKKNGTDVESLYFVPATGRNVRYVKTNFTIPTSGIANFSHALMTAFEVLLKYQDAKHMGGQCNQAIMLITDGSPSDFEEIFNRYNYPNAPVRVFTYLIGRETGDGTHTKMMACHNRGYYTHVINLAEVRETVQQYVPVMARPLVLNRAHPITWTPAYGDLTYQILTDWIWESKRRERAKAILALKGRGAASNQQAFGGVSAGSFVPDISITNGDNEHSERGSTLLDPMDEQEQGPTSNNPSDGNLYLDNDPHELDAIDIFGYQSNPDCFWEITQNDLLTTVVQPVHDLKNDTKIVERFLNKNTWVTRETTVRTANLLGVAAADMKISDIIGLAPSHKLGPNSYAVLLTNNGLVMHHPDLRSVLEPHFNQMLSTEALDFSQTGRAHSRPNRGPRILKPFFSSLDFTQVEHILHQANDADLLKLRKEAIEGLTGWRELATKRTMDCQRRVQSRKQNFYYKSLEQFPFSFMISIPQPYGSHRLEAQVDIKSAPASLPERLTTYFTTSDFDIWTVHPEYDYCTGPSNNTITSLLDMFQRIQEQQLDDLQQRPAESSKPPIYLPGKIVYNKELVQSLVYDAVATYGFSESCSLPNPSGESNFLSMFGVRFSFVSTRSGLTRVRHFVDDNTVKREALAFARRHSRGPDETFYKRTVDYNLLINSTATLVQVPFNMHQKILARFEQYDMEQLDRMADQTEAGSSLGVGQQMGDELGASQDTKLKVSEMDLFERLDLLANSSLHLIATQSIVVHEGNQRAVAGVTGVFYDYAQFVLRFFNTTNSNLLTTLSTKSSVKCGYLNDTTDCLLVDNNGYILVSEELEFIGRHLSEYEPTIMSRLVRAAVFHEVNVTDYQSICLDEGEKQSSVSSGTIKTKSIEISLKLFQNVISILAYSWAFLLTLSGFLWETAGAFIVENLANRPQQNLLSTTLQPPMLSLIPNKTYLRPCERILTRYETRPGIFESEVPEYFTARCNCPAWFVYEQVSQTNLILIITDTARVCTYKCDQGIHDHLQQPDQMGTIVGQSESRVCSMFERESKLDKRTLDSCYSHHPDEEHIKVCGSADTSGRHLSQTLILISLLITQIYINHFGSMLHQQR